MVTMIHVLDESAYTPEICRGCTSEGKIAGVEPIEPGRRDALGAVFGTPCYDLFEAKKLNYVRYYYCLQHNELPEPERTALKEVASAIWISGRM